METSRYLLLSTLLATGCPWVMKSSHTNVIPNLTDDVTLHCFCDTPFDTKPVIEQITRIRILKMNDSRIWNAYAEIVITGNSVQFAEPDLSGIEASGHLGKLNESFLLVTWETASDETVGSYTCEVDGFATRQGTNTQINTAVVNITNNAVTVGDLLTVAVQMKQKANSMSREMKMLKEVISLQHQELTKVIMTSVLSELEDNYFELRYWPTDSYYTLLSPAEGCPDTSFSQMINGFFKYETELSRPPSHNLSTPNHLHPDVMESCGSRHILHFRFCRNPDPDGRNVPWPKGTYCIHRHGDCPKGFPTGYLELFMPNSPSVSISENLIGNTFNWKQDKLTIYHHFCCRNDGDVDEPILLPNQKPFYLYRYKGKCQKVFNTNVTEEWLLLDTDDSKTDKYSSTIYPDSELNDARIQLCYYQHS